MFVDLYITNTTAGHPLMAKKNMENKTGHTNGHAHVLKLTAMVGTRTKSLETHKNDIEKMINFNLPT